MDGGLSIRVLTFNAWFYSDPWWYHPPRGAVPGSAASRLQPAPSWPRRRDLILRAIQETQPDVIGLQEVGRDGRWGPEAPDQAAQIAEAAGFRVLYQPSQVGASPRTPLWEYGLAVLSRHPLADATALRLPSNPAHPRDVHRMCQAVTVRAPAGELALFNTHFSLDPDARLASARMVGSFVQRFAGRRPRVIVGDLNALPRSKTLRALTNGRFCDAWRAVHGGRPGFTFPSHEPARTFDYVLVGGLEVHDARLVGDAPDALGFYASDHLGVVATLAVANGGQEVVY